jgi:O-methyltransferase
MQKSAILRDQYLDLMEKVLTGMLDGDPALKVAGGGVYNAEVRENGRDWPSKSFTMIGLKRLRNFRRAIEDAIGSGIPGDFIETGVWRGGACIFARAILFANNVTDRKVIVADSFEGLPPPNAAAYPADQDSDFHTYPDLAVSLEQVKDNFARFNLLDDQVQFLKGWFRNTMRIAARETYAVIRLDGDMYESTIDPLRALWDRLSPGGWVIVDDYSLVPACRSAVHDFLDQRGLTADIHDIDGIGVYFRKSLEGQRQNTEFSAMAD